MLLSLLIGATLVAAAASAECHSSDYSYYAASNKCYVYHGDLVTFDTADAVCKSSNGQLVTPRSAEADTDLAATFSHPFAPIWLGIVDPVPDKNFIYMDTDGPVTGHSDWYIPIADQEGIYSCVVSGPWESQRKWVPTSCSATASTVCEAAPKEPTCNTKKGWVKRQTDKCFKAYKGHRRFDYDQAKSYCESVGGLLATDIVSEEQRKDIGKLTRFVGNSWIGYHDRDADGVYTDIIHGLPLTEGNDAFKRGLPRAGRCISFKRRWFFPRNCHRRQRVICQKDATYA